ncbi:MAG: transcriptional regulator NrdR [Planctomycetes bacterium]|nr:transcriptional regulator NrdR [Planctomycetota bacterium]
MRCPFCQHDDDKVVDSRASDDGVAIRRRRECLKCSRRFTTYERIEVSPLRVIKKDGRRVPYDREKVRRGIEKACWNLPISAEQIDKMVDAIEGVAFEKYEREVPSQELGNLVMQELRKLHQVAYVRFASVYREFKDVSEFMDVLEEFVKGRARNAGKGNGEVQPKV